MRTSDELFQLIRSLTKSEKRYFKLFTSRHSGEKKYLLLFDAIDAQESYDEGAIRERFREEKFTKQLNVAKKYLYDQILKSLRVYHAEATVKAEIQETLASVEILYEKGLRHHAERMLEKAIAQARAYDHMPLLLEALGWQNRLRPEIGSTLESIDESYNAQFEALDLHRNMLEYERLLDITRLPTLGGHAHTAEELSLLRKVRLHPLMEAERMATSLKSRLLYLWTEQCYYHARDDFQQSLGYGEMVVALFESQPHYILEYPKQYLAALNNLMVLLRYTNDMEGFERGMEKLRSVAQSLLRNGLQNRRLRGHVFDFVYRNYFTEFVLRGEFERALELVDEIDDGLARYEDLFVDGTALSFIFQQAVLFIGVEDYPRALELINRIIQEPEPEYGRKSYYQAHILNLIVHFELGNIDLIEHLVRSTHRLFRTRETLYAFESKMLAFFRKLPRLYTQGAMLDAFRQLRAELSPLESDPNEYHPFRYFHYLEWLDARIQGRRYRDLVREHVLAEERKLRVAA